MRDGRPLCHRHRAVPTQDRPDCRVVLQYFPTLVDLEDSVIRRRDANESSYYLGMGNWVPAKLVAITTRTFFGRNVSGRGFPVQTTGGDSSGSARRLSTSPKLSSQPQFGANEFGYSGSHPHSRIFSHPRLGDDCALE